MLDGGEDVSLDRRNACHELGFTWNHYRGSPESLATVLQAFRALNLDPDEDNSERVFELFQAECWARAGAEIGANRHLNEAARQNRLAHRSREILYFDFYGENDVLSSEYNRPGHPDNFIRMPLADFVRALIHERTDAFVFNTTARDALSESSDDR